MMENDGAVSPAGRRGDYSAELGLATFLSISSSAKVRLETTTHKPNAIRIQDSRHPTPDSRLKTRDSLFVEVVCGFEPAFHFVVDVFQRGYGKTMGYPILLFEAARLEEPPLRASRTQRQPEVDSSAGRRLDLSENMIAIKWNNRLARTGFNVLSNTESERQQAVMERPQSGFGS